MTVLVDTSVWIDHFRARDASLSALLAAGTVGMHSAVIGELAVGSLGDRDETLRSLRLLNRVREATAAETLTLLDSRRLYGRAIGWVDMQLLASAQAAGMQFWVRDTRTLAAARELGIAYDGG